MSDTRRLWIVFVILALLLEPAVHAQSQPGGSTEQSPIGGSGGGSRTGGSAAGGVDGGGFYDGNNDIDWNGPDILPNAPLIFEPFPAND